MNGSEGASKNVGRVIQLIILSESLDECIIWRFVVRPPTTHPCVGPSVNMMNKI